MPAEANICPRPLYRATRLVIVTVPEMDTSKAELRTFERALPTGGWTLTGGPEPAVVGARGIGWGHPYAYLARGSEPRKEEGDLRTPAGIYRMGTMFGFAKDDRPDYIQLTPGTQFCVEDTSSPYYGRIVPQSMAGEKTSGQNMATVPQFKRGIFIDYPPRAARKAGSCIFLQVWRGDGAGTSAHVGLPEDRIRHLQDWGKGRFMAIAILQKDTISRFSGCLPDLSGGQNTGPVALPVPDPRHLMGRN
jgi:L,D-peptidoglycan transpeptidase YkuD (ErfK/YbiS/YcfS/YnhG family)